MVRSSRLGEPYQCTVQISHNIVSFHGFCTQYFESPLHFNAKSILLCSCDWKSLLANCLLKIYKSKNREREITRTIVIILLSPIIFYFDRSAVVSM